MPNLIDYTIAETYLGNDDWLWANNNVLPWKPEHGGKWRFVLIDLDASMRDPELDMMQHISLAGSSYFSRLFMLLTQNATFREAYLNRHAEVVRTCFGSARFVHVIDSIAGLIEPEIVAQHERWYYPASVAVWEDAVERLRVFARTRPAIVARQLDALLEQAD